jgi:hypothetical protein
MAEGISLNGEWLFHRGDTEGWQYAQVPGTAHQDLLCLEAIPDPFYRVGLL